MDAVSSSSSAAGPSRPPSTRLHSSPISPSGRTSSRHALTRTYLDGVPAPPLRTGASRQRLKKGKESTHISKQKKRETLKPESTGISKGSKHHSHGLSWSSTTRDSVVDNLLLSLGNLSTQDVPDMDEVHDHEFDKDRYRMPEMPQLPTFAKTRPTERPRGHTYSSSLSSGYDGHTKVITGSPASKHSGSAKPRRSDSSSSPRLYGSSNSRIHPAMRVVRTSSDTARPSEHIVLRESPIGSLEDVSNGIGAVQGANRANWSGRRSISLDQIYTQPHSASTVLDRGRPVPSVHSSYDADFHTDAAPEPGVPAGPRKKQYPAASGPVFINSAPTKQSNLRKTNIQNEIRIVSKSNAQIPQYIHDQASDFVRTNSVPGDVPIPLQYAQSAPASSLGLRTARKDALALNRERPGFFKRYFGGGSRTPSGLSERSESQDSSGLQDSIGPPSRRQPSYEMISQTRQQSKERDVAPPLNKKPSSFFRRRKKSGTDSMPPPLPTPVPSYNEPRELSPSVSSLRQVMNPYLNKDSPVRTGTPLGVIGDLSRPETQDSTVTGSDELDIFHSGYTPPPDASLRRRDPMRRSSSRRTKDAPDDREDSPKVKIKVKKRAPGALDHVSEQAQRFYGKGDIPYDALPNASTEAQQYLRGRSSRHDARDYSSEHAQHYFERRTSRHDATREASITSLGPQSSYTRISPLSEAPPDITDDEENQRPVSRASTGDRIIAAKAVNQKRSSAEMRSFSAGTNVSIDPDDEGWVVSHRPSGEANNERNRTTSGRLFLQPTEAEDRHGESTDTLSPSGGSRTSSMSVSVLAPDDAVTNCAPLKSPAVTSIYYSTTSLQLPSVHVEGRELPRKSTETTIEPATQVSDDIGAEYRERARKIYNGNQDDVDSGEAASWLGENNTLSMRTLQAYMQLFDFAGQNILSALRTLCKKLLLKGETQQFDRIITALSARWCECNSNHGFKAQDVVHTICYSLILLNTDLHMADIGEKMSKSAYVKNTLPTVRRVVVDAAPNAFDDTIRPSQNVERPTLPWVEAAGSSPTSPTFPEIVVDRTSFEVPRPNAIKRMSMRPGMFRSESDGWAAESSPGNPANALVNQPWSGSMRGWESEIESVLKSFFASIRSEPLHLLGAPGTDTFATDRSLSVANMSGLKRSGSTISKAPSEAMSFRSKPGFRTMTTGWQNRNTRSRPKLYPPSTAGSSRTSFDDGNSNWTPTQNSNWSKVSFAKTLTSASVSSLGYHFTPAVSDYKHSIGFANALSQAIIREESVVAGPGDADSVSVPDGLLEDEALALEGAPWAKEGLVKHKHHLETPDRKAKERSWNDCFAVISKGKLTLFAFNTTSKSQSMGRKAQQKHNAGRAGSVTGNKVGGGDWMENAEELAVFVLRQTIASTLPKPGYSKARPHVWALSLPSGAVHLFQVGTPEIALEFITCANYWSARLSKEPLAGGVSNVEYGWSDQIINVALLDRPEAHASPPTSTSSRTGHVQQSSTSGNMPRPSYQSSLRGSFDTGFGNTKARTTGDKAQLAEWHPPTQSMMASQLEETDQLKALTAYVSNVEVELEKHNEMKQAIDLAYSPRHANHTRSMSNWQRKSDYLLREIVKFRTYMETLSAAHQSKEEYYARKAEHGTVNKVAVSPVDSGRMKEERDATPRQSSTQMSAQ